MKKTLLITSVILSTFSSAQNLSNEFGGVYPTEKNDANHPCITPKQYKLIESQLADNRKTLGLANKLQRTAMSTTFSWPLKLSNTASSCSYYYIGAHVDEDTTSPGIKDWNCGAVTYDGHRGTDITSSPYPYYAMDNNQLDVIAAAPGTIVNKIDGHYDKNCTSPDSIANYIIIEHADGSVALYWHMKKNSLTAKTVGQTVAIGEFLGQVGSSGVASGPHLHFEVWSGTTANTLKDPYSGACNIFNASTLWTTQKPYREPAILKAQINTIAPVFPACPATETPNEDSCFTAGVTAKFYIFIRNETSGLAANMSIISPGGATYSSWTHNSVNTYTPTAFYYTNKVLPSTAGTYTFQATYNGTTCAKTFTVNCGTTGINQVADKNDVSIYPNPTTGMLNIEGLISNSNISICDVLGNELMQKVMQQNTTAMDVSGLASGVYFIRTNNGMQKFIKQ